MNNNKRYRISTKRLLTLCFLLCGIVMGEVFLFHKNVLAQDVSMHTQGVMQQEFLNPAYNSFKSDISLSAYNRTQWNSKFENTPETYLVNLFVPIKTARLGVNLQTIVESIGLRTTTEFKASLCNNIQLSEGAFLSFGYSVGFLQNAFDQNKIVSLS